MLPRVARCILRSFLPTLLRSHACAHSHPSRSVASVSLKREKSLLLGSWVEGIGIRFVL